MTARYTAILDVVRTTTTPVPSTSSRYDSPTPEPKSVSSELAKVVVRADTLEALLARVTAHCALIDE